MFKYLRCYIPCYNCYVNGNAKLSLDTNFHELKPDQPNLPLPDGSIFWSVAVCKRFVTSPQGLIWGDTRPNYSPHLSRACPVRTGLASPASGHRGPRA